MTNAYYCMYVCMYGCFIPLGYGMDINPPSISNCVLNYLSSCECIITQVVEYSKRGWPVSSIDNRQVIEFF